MKNNYPLLICEKGKIDCTYCKNVGLLKIKKSQGVKILNKWSSLKIDGGANEVRATR